jgi:SAM-dependent methyltransferase
VSRLTFDEDMLAHLEVLYRKRDVLRRRALVREALGAAPGERVLDVGCGPGFYTAELFEQVGASGAVVGVDASAAMLAAAARRCPGATFHEGLATELQVADESFDAALTVQVLEYVEDVDAALAELHRVLRPGGRALVWDVDWSTASMHSSDPARMDRVLKAWDGHLAHPALPRTLGAGLRRAGFEAVRAEGHAFATIDFDDETYGASLVPMIEGYVGGEEAAAWAAEQRALGERGEFSFACIQFCFTAQRTRTRATAE